MTTHTASAPSQKISDPTLATAPSLPSGSALLVGDTVISMPNDGASFLVFVAGANTTVQANAIVGSSPSAVSLTSGKTYFLGPFDRSVYNNAAGNMTLTLGTGSASHTAVLVQTHTGVGAPTALHNPFETSATARDA